MDFDQIMREITAGLTGDNAQDIAYLKEQMEKYKDHEFGKEIIRACGRLIFPMLPDEMKEKLGHIAENEDLGIKATLDEVGYNIYKKDFANAPKLMEALVSKVDEAHEGGLFKDDAVSTYRSFNETFEEVLCRHLNETGKDIRICPHPLHVVYARYGSLLFEMKRFDEAEKALEKALAWDPVYTDALFERAECHKVTGDMQGFFDLTVDAFKCAYTPKAVARCFRNLGFYFVEKKLWSEAMSCFLASMDYEKDSVNAQSEMYYIQHQAGQPFAIPTLEDFRSYGEKYGFPLQPSDDVLGLTYSYGKHFANQGNADIAGYFLNIFYDLTQDEEVKALLDSLGTGEK